MRFLEFTISGQKIQKARDCDFTGIVAGSQGYLSARFHFSNDWVGCKKVAVFIQNGEDYPAAIVNNTCEIPPEALTGRLVKLYVIGRRPGLELPTNTTAFSQTVARKGG